MWWCMHSDVCIMYTLEGESLCHCRSILELCLGVCVCVCVCRLIQLLKDQSSASKSFYRLLVMDFTRTILKSSVSNK